MLSFSPTGYFGQHPEIQGKRIAPVVRLAAVWPGAEPPGYIAKTPLQRARTG
ncbi:MAG TPA: hypothetical protein VNA16_03650 [Abditibacteriaceae bacterium]|nr:hypothetical protein [Abditibacteriaceae bacterium]